MNAQRSLFLDSDLSPNLYQKYRELFFSDLCDFYNSNIPSYVDADQAVDEIKKCPDILDGIVKYVKNKIVTFRVTSTFLEQSSASKNFTLTI